MTDSSQPYQKVQVWVIDPITEDVLCLKTNKKRGEFWQPITGSVEKGESLLQAAARETLEETGLIVQESELFDSGFSFDFTGQWGQAKESVFYFLHAAKDIQTDPNEHTEFKWLSNSAALDKIKYESNQQGLKSCLDHLKKRMN